MKNRFRYTLLEKYIKILYRSIFPIQKSSYTIGEIEDICKVNLIPTKDLQKFFENSINKLKKIKGENIGDYLEFGVFNGSSISSMYIASKNIGANIKLYGFDAFEGLPKESENEDNGVRKEGFYSCSFEEMNKCLEKRGIDKKNITFIKGWYQDTLNEETIQNNNIKNIGIVFIDCDTYSSSKAVLKFIGPIINNTIIICFDDWKLNNLDIKNMGEYKAFNEFLDKNNHLKAKEIKSYNRKSKSFIISNNSYNFNS